MKITPEDHSHIEGTLETLLEHVKSYRVGTMESAIYQGEINGKEITCKLRLYRNKRHQNELEVALMDNFKTLHKKQHLVDISHAMFNDDRINIAYDSQTLQPVRITIPIERLSFIDDTYKQRPMDSVTSDEDIPAPPKKVQRGLHTSKDEREEQIPEQASEYDQTYRGEPLVLWAGMRYSPLSIIEQVIDRIPEYGIANELLRKAHSRARSITGTQTYVPLNAPDLEAPAENIASFLKTELPARYQEAIRLEQLPSHEGEFKSLDLIREEFLRGRPRVGETDFELFREIISESNEFTIDDHSYSRDELVQGDKVHVLLIEHYKSL